MTRFADATAWIAQPETAWIYDKLLRMLSPEPDYPRLDLTGLSEQLQYTVYGGGGGRTAITIGVDRTVTPARSCR